MFLTQNEYNEMFPKYPLEEDDFNEHCEMAEEDISSAIGVLDFTKIPEEQQECLRRAIGYQTIFSVGKGGLDERNNPYYDWTALDGFEYRYKKMGVEIIVNGISMSERAVNLLENCGLFYRGSRGYYDF